MKELSKKELINIDGGVDITGTLITTLLKGAELFYNFGKSFGISLKRMFSSKY